MKTLPLSLVIPTADRHVVLKRMLESVWSQNVWPREIILVDASQDAQTSEICCAIQEKFGSDVLIRCIPAEERGAAVQRNQGVALTQEDVIGFADDDVLLEPQALARLWDALQSSPEIGGANALITNQKYHEPGRTSRFVYRMIGGGAGPDYAGRIFGPAVNLLPADREGMPEIVPVGWLNLGLTLYRREALPKPPFDLKFTGYSMMEDAALSLIVARKWKLVNARTARIFHDTQTGSHKANAMLVAQMAVVNRDFVARRVMGKRGVNYWVSLTVWGVFQIAAIAAQVFRDPRKWSVLRGTMRGYFDIISGPSLPSL